MSGRHTGEQHSHTVEGTDPQLYVALHEPEKDAGYRPIMLLHGFPGMAAAAPPRIWTHTRRAGSGQISSR